jgi:hypothetical protein
MRAKEGEEGEDVGCDWCGNEDSDCLGRFTYSELIYGIFSYLFSWL